MRLLWRRGVRRRGIVRLLGRLLVSRLTPRTPLSSWWPQAFARYLGGLERKRLTPLALAAARQVAKEVRPALRDALARESLQGAELWLVSATVDLLAEAVAGELGFSCCVCTRLALDGPRYAGTLLGPICRGKEKLLRVRHELAQRGLTAEWAVCSYYADGYEDLPLLEAVGRPVVVHPDARLAEVAKERDYTAVGPRRGQRLGR